MVNVSSLVDFRVVNNIKMEPAVHGANLESRMQPFLLLRRLQINVPSSIFDGRSLSSDGGLFVISSLAKGIVFS